MTAAEALRELAHVVEPLLDPSPLHDAAAQLESPARWVVVGRVGAGKTTLVNAWTQATDPTGLGGVTKRNVCRPVGDAELWDTRGIDDPDAAIVQLGGLLADADGIVWVVDGLQPLTASERHVVAALVDGSTARHVVISRADLLEPTDADAVARRVQQLTDTRPAVSDLRRAPPPCPELAPGRHRAAAARRALDEVRTALAAGGGAPTLADLRLRFRDAIRAAVARIEAGIEAGRVPDKGAALAALGREVEAVRRATVGTLTPPLPNLSRPRAPTDGLMGQVLDRFSGREGARRILKAEAARWLMEGQAHLADWFDERSDLRALAAAHARIEERLAAAEEALACGSCPG